MHYSPGSSRVGINSCQPQRRTSFWLGWYSALVSTAAVVDADRVLVHSFGWLAEGSIKPQRPLANKSSHFTYPILSTTFSAFKPYCLVSLLSVLVTIPALQASPFRVPFSPYTFLVMKVAVMAFIIFTPLRTAMLTSGRPSVLLLDLEKSMLTCTVKDDR